MNPFRDTIFISHATPEDNPFTEWLYGDGIPVTLRFTNAIGEVLTGPIGNIEVLPFKHYV